MSAPRVTGGTYNGGTALELRCPRILDDERCDAELECEQTAGGLLVHPKECPYCGATYGPLDILCLEAQAKQAFDSYSGPSDAQMAGQYAACEPRDAWNGR